jgi:hypothetical protein
MTHPLADFCLRTVGDLRGRQNIFGGPARLLKDAARTTCSTFLTLALQRTYDVGPALWPALFDVKRPRARDYQRAFAAGMLGPPIERVEDIRPGTVGAIGYDEDRDGMSGHCFVVVGSPIKRHGVDGYVLRVVDSCRSMHGSDDTRAATPGGIGMGEMVLLVDENKAVKGYRWSLAFDSVACLNGSGQTLSFANIPTSWSLRHG